MTSSDSALRKSRGRPRTPGAEGRILEAALEEYGERGWAGFTMDAVARRAGVGKSTVYLRWRDKDSLLTDAIEAHSSGIEEVDTGSLRSDLEQLAANLFRHYMDPIGWATVRLTVDAATASAALGMFGQRVARRHSESLFAIVGRAIERGEVPADFPTMTLFQCLYGAVTMQSMTLLGARRDLTDDEIARRVTPLVEFVMPS
ncbi:TetR/AcrR family transcriptional regulator [Nocardioides sp.]|jgi:AcrR family transcriptional regulator|uniref:TetR/AcrR family transcriptional regulator n=1 Tax=Nocardioides sp. TaxID=35761 RepID=UPI0031FE7AA1|nr:transcriptional regulator, TetR family [Nocardioides sp.]